jgi:hypothetical protein
MELRFADTKENIATRFGNMPIFSVARIKARQTRRVIEITGQCIYCGKPEKPLRGQSLDEMFSWCCERAERESRLVHEAQHECDLCGKYSFKSEPHKSCMDYEQGYADFANRELNQAVI